MVVAQVRRSVRARALLAPGERVLVACSGGPDSAALLHVLTRLAPELSIELRAASVDHQLRPGSEDAVRTARALAERLGVPFAALSVEVPREGASVQAKAREERYRALREEAARVGASAIAVGHTLDDQAETVVSRLLRGSGVRGLAAIEPRRADGVVRPLLDCARADVLAHALRFELPFVRDPANREEAFERVRIRERLLPALAEEDPRLSEHLARLADEAREVAAMVGAAADTIDARAEHLSRGVVVGLPRLVGDEVLARWAEARTGRPARRAHVEELARVVRAGGEARLPLGWVARSRGDSLVAVHEPERPTRSRPDGSGASGREERPE